jgi:predicted nucleic acid-binding protein
MNLPTDSAVWLALYDRSDKYHNQAQLAFQELAERKVTFVVTDYLIAESVTLIMGRAGHAAVMCGGWLLNSPRVHLIRIGIDLWNEA